MSQCVMHLKLATLWHTAGEDISEKEAHNFCNSK